MGPIFAVKAFLVHLELTMVGIAKFGPEFLLGMLIVRKKPF